MFLRQLFVGGAPLSRALRAQASTASFGGDWVHVDPKSYAGASAKPFDSDVQEKLAASLEDDDIHIKPDGMLYLPADRYRILLSRVFGAGGWALVPRSDILASESLVVREYALFVHGRFVAQAPGDHALFSNSNLGVAIESARSRALTRCCKDLGVATELWDQNFVRQWREKHALHVWTTHQKTGEKRKSWRLASDPPFVWPLREQQDGDPPFTPSSSSSAGAGAGASSESSEAGSSVGQWTQPRTTSSDAQFDPEGVVPPFLKMYAGQPWIEVLSDPKGQGYLEWVRANLAPPAGVVAVQALDYWAEHQFDDNAADDSEHDSDYPGI
jgi:Mitochondrial genome maintenance MGM101